MCDCVDVDAAFADGIEESAGDAGVVLHSVSDDGDNRHLVLDMGGLGVAVANLVSKLLVDDLGGALGILGLDDERDCQFGRGLRDENDVDESVGESFEESGRDA